MLGHPNDVVEAEVKPGHHLIEAGKSRLGGQTLTTTRRRAESLAVKVLRVVTPFTEPEPVAVVQATAGDSGVESTAPEKINDTAGDEATGDDGKADDDESGDESDEESEEESEEGAPGDPEKARAKKGRGRNRVYRGGHDRAL